MNDGTTSFQEFLAKAVAILQTTGNELQELAQLALLSSEQPSPDHDNGRNSGTDYARLQKISRQLSDLSERSKILRLYLQEELDLPPLDDDHWPRIKILQSQEEERMQVARAMEDSVGQLLANAVFELASFRQLQSPTPTGSGDDEVSLDGLEELQLELEQGLTDFRHFIIELDPTTILSNFGLGGGIRRYLEQYEQKTGLKTSLRINTNFGRLPTMIEIAIFRIIQESLNNVYRHAGATQVEVVFAEEDGELQFSVIDDGGGLNSEKIGLSRKNLGLARMIDYAELLNGKLRLLSEPTRGTQVILSIPYPVS